MGAITVCRGLTQALTSPIGGVLGSRTNRVWVILLGCLLWASMTWLFGVSRWTPNPFVMGAIVWALNGLGLSLVVPNSQSVLADYYTPETRGRAFGLWFLYGNVGAVLGSLFATNLASWNSDALRGWQLVMFVLAAVSAIIGWLNVHFAHDPRDETVKAAIRALPEEEQHFLKDVQGHESHAEEKPGPMGWNEIYAAIGAVFLIPTFRIIILQGIVGSMPWKALASFSTLYLQLIGMSDFQAAVIFGTFLIGAALGGWLGGAIGDRVSVLSPNHGRILACQFSVFSGIPLMFVIFKLLPRDGAVLTGVLYGGVLFATGLLISWALPCCNSPIFAEIVQPRARNIIYAFDRCLEDALASPASYLVGLAAEKIWGFEGDATSSEDTEKDLGKAEALSQALLWFSVVPWSLCFVFYTGLHFTYHKDKRQNLPPED